MENRITVQDREELLYLLAEACELEHGLCCSYLFAAFSLKDDRAEGLDGDQLEAVTRWKQTIAGIAAQEMLHLALANNLRTALGAGPHFRRPNFPVQARYYPPEIQLALQPFSEETIAHFVYVERPAAALLADAPGYETETPPAATSPPPERVIVPTPQEYESVNDLYRAIQESFSKLVHKYGETSVFIGPPRAQATEKHFHFEGLIPVTDLASAIAAIDLIVDEGEGGSGKVEDSHYGKFVRIRDEYHALKRSRPDFVPARPVLPNPFARVPADAAAVSLIDDPFTVQVSDLFNGAYETLVQLLARFFMHTEETDAELKMLIDTAIAAMFTVIKPLGELLTTLPAGPSQPNYTAGPSFEFYRSGYTLPHKRAAWLLMQERLRELTSFSRRLEAEDGASAVLAEVTGALRGLADALRAHEPGGTAG